MAEGQPEFVYMWRIVRTFSNGKDIDFDTTLECFDKFKDSQEVIASQQLERNEFIAIDDREFIHIRDYESNGNMVYVIRRVG